MKILEIFNIVNIVSVIFIIVGFLLIIINLATDFEHAKYLDRPVQILIYGGLIGYAISIAYLIYSQICQQ